MKLPQENIGEALQDFGVQKVFLKKGLQRHRQ
jgi:hypothetical protein